MRRHTTLTVTGLAAAILVAAALAGAAVGQDTSSASPAPAGEVGQRSGEGSGAKPKGAPPAPAGAVGAKTGEGSSPPASSKPTPQHFEPTEKVRPDFDVAFPIDI